MVAKRTNKRMMDKRKHRKHRRTSKGKSVKGGGDAVFDPNFGGSFYSLNDYTNQLFSVSSTKQGGGGRGSTRKRKRNKKIV